MEKAKEIGTNFCDVPNSILLRIFERLSIATILHCRRVCKTWNSCLSSLDFSNSYQTNSPYPTLIHSNLFRKDDVLQFIRENHMTTEVLRIPPQISIEETRLVGSCLSSLDFSNSSQTNSPYPSLINSFLFPNCHLLQFIDKNIVTTKVFRIPPQISIEETRLVGSCNGLVCFLKSPEPFCKFQGVVDIFVGNPILGEYCLISGPKFKSKVDYEIQCQTYGFGFSLNSGHYKVVRMLAFKHGNQEYAEFQILTVGVDEDWRVLDCQISSIPKKLTEETRCKHRVLDFTYFSGAVYWLSADEGILDTIYSFDFSKESVGILSPPPKFKDNKCEKKLAVLKDCLCLVVYDLTHLTIQSIKQYGLSDSRSKDVPWSILMENGGMPFFPVGRWRKGEEILFRSGNIYFISYNIIIKYSTFVQFTDLTWSCCVPYSFSLIHLRDALQISKNKDNLPLKFLDRPSFPWESDMHKGVE